MLQFELLLVCLVLIILITRSLPFFFVHALKDNQKLRLLERSMPAYIMMLLVVYELKPASMLSWPYGLPEVASLLILSIVQFMFRQIIVTLIVGTLSCIVLIKFFGS